MESTSTVLSTDAAALRVFERIFLRKIFGPVRDSDDFLIRFNSDLLSSSTPKMLRRLLWLGHVVRMVEDAPIKRVFDTRIYGSRPLEGPNPGSPVIAWCDQMAYSRKKQRLLEGYVAAGQNPLIRLS